MNEKEKFFYSINEPFGAGIMEAPERSSFYRLSLGLKRYYENMPLTKYDGKKLFPCGKSMASSFCMRSDKQWVLTAWGLESKSKKAVEYLKEEDFIFFESSVPCEHTIGGEMYTHSMPNYSRILKEGLNGYKRRIEKCKDGDFRDGLLEILSGIENYHARAMEYLKLENADAELIAALERVPFEPARTLYEAIVCWNFIYYLDNCDNIGRLDADLYPYYRGENVVELLRDMFKYIDINDGWTGAIGPRYNELSYQVLEASKGLRRPSLELRVTPDMPEELWDLAVENIKSGAGQPSLFNEKILQEELKRHFPKIPDEDMQKICGGGCTEFMLAGVSNVGSLDAGINMLLVFKNFLDENLYKYENFESFYEAFIEKATQVTENVIKQVGLSRKKRAEKFPNPLRTLLIDDCIEREKDYNAGGARYMWSDINIAGQINVIDSLLAIKELYFEQGRYRNFIELLNNEDEELFASLKKCTHFGTDDEKANEMAYRFTTDICKPFEGKSDEYAMGYLPASIQFITSAMAGEPVGPTPDGRRNHAPACESLGAIHANDTKGPTALIKSVTSINLRKMLGIPVFNFNVNKSVSNENLKALLKSYISLGGVQMQVTCTSKEDVLAALKNPGEHKNLIVRIGGYSEYFCRLSPSLRQLVAERILHEN